MAFNKRNENYYFKVLLITTLMVIPAIATTNIDCNGKAFYCVNSTHFKICVDFGGVSITVDDFLITCPPNTVCTDNNYFECEYQVSTTSAVVTIQSDVTNEFTEKPIITTPQELFEDTLFPVYNHEPSTEFKGNWTTNTTEAVSKVGSTEAISTVGPTEAVFKVGVTEKENVVSYTPFLIRVITDSPNNTYDTTLSDSAKFYYNRATLIDNSETTFTATNVKEYDISSHTTSVTTGSLLSTESEKLLDLLNPIITTPLNIQKVDLTSTKIISPMKTDSLSINISPASVAIEKETRNDIPEEDTTTPSYNLENVHFTSTNLISLMNADDGSLDNLHTETTTDNAVTQSETFLELFDSSTLSNIIHKSASIDPILSLNYLEPAEKQTVSEMIIKDFDIINTGDKYESNILSTQQNIADTNVDPSHYTVTNANVIYTTDGLTTSSDRLNDFSMYENSAYIDGIVEVSTRITKVDTLEMDLRATFDTNEILNNTIKEYRMNKHNDSSSLITDAGFVNNDTIVSSPETIKPSFTTDSYYALTIQKDPPVTDLILPLQQEKDSNETVLTSFKNIDLNSHISVKKLPPEKNSVNITSHDTDQQIITKIDFYVNAANKTTQLNNSSLHKKDNFTLSKADFASTIDDYNNHIHSTKPVDKPSRKNESTIEEQVRPTTLLLFSDIDTIIITESFTENMQQTSEPNELYTKLNKKLKNGTSQDFHENISYRNRIIEIAPTQPSFSDSDFKLIVNSINSDKLETTKAVHMALNTKMKEFSLKEADILPSSEISDIEPITENSVNSIDLFDLNIESNTQREAKATEFSLPMSSSTNIQYLPTAEIVIVENSAVTENYKLVQNLPIQRYDKDNQSDSMSSISNLTNSLTRSNNSTDSSLMEPDLYDYTTNTYSKLSTTEGIFDHVFSSTIVRKEPLINNMGRNLTKTENKSSSNMYNFTDNISKYLLNVVDSVNNTTHTTSKEKNVTNVNITTTFKTLRDTSMDIVHDLQTLKTTPEDMIVNEILLTEFQSQPTTENYDFNERVINHLNIKVNLTEIVILNTTKDNQSFNKIKKNETLNDVNNIINNNIIIEKDTYRNILPEIIADTKNLKEFQIINATNKNNTSSNIVSYIESNLLYENIQKPNNTIQDIKTGKNSTNTNGITESSVKPEIILSKPLIKSIHSLSSTDKNIYNISPTLQFNIKEVIAPVQNKFTSIEQTTPLITKLVYDNNIYVYNTLKPSNLSQNYDIAISNNTKSKIISKNSTNATHDTENILAPKVKLSSAPAINSTKIHTSSSVRETNLQLSKNINLIENATLSNNNVSINILAAKKIRKENNTSEKDLTISDSKSNGLNVLNIEDKLFLMQNKQNTIHRANTSVQHQKNFFFYMFQDLNFTKLFHNNSSLGTNAEINLFTHDVIPQTSPIINLTMVRNYSSNPIKSAIATHSISISKENISNSRDNFINISKTEENDDDLYKTGNVVNELKMYDINNLKLNVPVLTNKGRRIEETNKRFVNLSDKNVLEDYESTNSKFSCKARLRGRYSDKNDCQNFYICIGRNEPIFGKCPTHTVFSEISKQCTKNLSHCVRNNQFRCTSAGRYIDIFSYQYYYICFKKANGYLRFKLKCQKGYHLDKLKLQCILDSYNGSMSSEDSSNNESEISIADNKYKKGKGSKNNNEDFECKNEGKYEYPGDCRKYYVCTKPRKSEFRRKIKKCDSDEIFDDKKKKCVDDDSYECEP